MLKNDSNQRHISFTGKIRWVYLILCAAALIGFFLPWAQLTASAAPGEQGEAFVLRLDQIIRQSADYTIKHDLGVFGSMNPIASLNLLYAIPIMGVLMIGLLFTRLTQVKRVLGVFLAGLLTAAPLYASIIVKQNLGHFEEIALYRSHMGAMVCLLAGIGLFVLLRLDREEKELASDIYSEKEERLNGMYLAFSIASLLSLFLPFVRILIPAGLTSVQTYAMSLFEFIRIAGHVEVIALFSHFGEPISLGFSAVFYLIPLAVLAAVMGVLIKNRPLRRLSALVSGVFMMAAPVAVMTALTDNAANIEQISRVKMQYGAIAVFVLGVCFFQAFVSDKPKRQIDFEQQSIANHKIGYIALSALGCALFFLPWVGLSAPVANALGLYGGQMAEGMAWPVNGPASVAFAGAWANILYLIPVAAALTILSAAFHWDRLKKIAAGAAAALMSAGPVLTYVRLHSLYSETGIVKLRMMSLLLAAAGIALFITLVTDKRTEVGLKIVWDKVKKAFEGIVTAIFAVIQLYPLVWMVLASFKNNHEIFSGKVLGLPSVWRFANYSKVLFGARGDETVRMAIERVMRREKDMTLFKYIIGSGAEGNIIRYFMNSTFIVIVTVLAVVVFGAMAAYAISRIKWKYSRIAFIFFLLGMMIPVHVALSPLYITFAGVGLIDSLWGLIIPYIGFGLPLAIIVLCGFLESIPYEIEESATIDGASIFTVFFRIVMPMVLPAIATVTIFTFLQSWNELMFATSFIQSGIKRTITVGINALAISQYNTEYAMIFAGLVIASLPTIILYLVSSQQVQKSLIVGAVKG